MINLHKPFFTLERFEIRAANRFLKFGFSLSEPLSIRVRRLRHQMQLCVGVCVIYRFIISEYIIFLSRVCVQLQMPASERHAMLLSACHVPATARSHE